MYCRFETFVGVPPTEDNIKKFLSNVPLGRLTDPNDVANYCLFLASDEGRFITGTCLEVDGGRGI
jgi:NAD(P)-dependent dehydrogenase (short-subunit alcohol dehydrogenase family)